MNMLKRFWSDERGTETVEWAIVLGVIAIGAILLAATLGSYVQGAFESTVGAFEEAGAPMATADPVAP